MHFAPRSEWCILAGRIEWNTAEARYAACFKSGKGQPAVPLRQAMGALIIQTISAGILLAGFASEYNLIIKAGLVLVILILQSPRIASEWRLWRDSHRAQGDRA